MSLFNVVFLFRWAGRRIPFKGFKSFRVVDTFFVYVVGAITSSFACYMFLKGFSYVSDVMISVAFIILFIYYVLKCLFKNPKSGTIIRMIVMAVCNLGNLLYAWSNVFCVNCETVEELYVRLDLLGCFTALALTCWAEEYEEGAAKFYVLPIFFCFNNYYEYGTGWIVHVLLGVVAAIRIALHHHGTMKKKVE